MPVIIKVPMARFQGVAYNWIKATGTLRLDPRQRPVRQHLPHHRAPQQQGHGAA